LKQFEIPDEREFGGCGISINMWRENLPRGGTDSAHEEINPASLEGGTGDINEKNLQEQA